MQNRRNFLKQASLMLAGGLVAPQLLSSCGGFQYFLDTFFFYKVS